MTNDGYMLDVYYGTDKYLPLMCAYCPIFQDDDERDAHGRKGYCVEVQDIVHHTDWCHKPEEIERHKKAMSEYVDGSRNKHGHQHNHQ